MVNTHSPIGVFDSGLGGLTVLRALRKRLPHESLIYVGDTARVPYGPKSPDTVRRYASDIADWLVAQGVKAIVVACNTATAHALADLRARLPIPVIGVIEPGARAAVDASHRGRGPIGVIGTAGTIASGAYERAISALDADAVVHVAACPLLVPLVEEGWVDHEATRLIVRDYLAPLRAEGLSTLVLGCTHYPLLAPVLAHELGPSVDLIDSADETARETALCLSQAQLLRGPRSTPDIADAVRFVASDDPARFLALGRRFFGDEMSHVEHVAFA
jgi:glutamate racemase